MKRGTFKIKPRKLLSRSPFKKSGKVGLRRTKIRVAGKSDTKTVKDEIQAVLREIVILRDKGCVLRMERGCGGELGAIGVVLQADHLITRANSATYADSRLVVCVCRRCHAWKSLGSNLRKAQYDELVKTILPESRVKLWEKCERDSWQPKRVSVRDWKLELVVLRQELDKMKERLSTGIKY